MGSSPTYSTILIKVTLSRPKKITLQGVLKYDSIFDVRKLYESVLNYRDVVQLARIPGLGPGGRWFESSLPDLKLWDCSSVGRALD